MGKIVSLPKTIAAALLIVSCSAQAYQAADPEQTLQQTAAQDFAGQWEGEVQTQQWPFYISVRIPADGRQNAELNALGTTMLLVDRRTENGGIAMTLQGPWESPPTISLSRNGDSLAGFWREGDASMPISLVPLPDYPAPANREEAWVQDINALSNRFLHFDRTFSPTARREFLGRMDRIANAISGMMDAEIMIALAQAAALSGNAHTRLYLLRRKTVLDRLPVRLWWFDGELRIIRTSERYSGYLGCRVDAISGVEAEDAHRTAASAFAGNESWARYKSVYYLSSADALAGLGIVDENESIELQLADCASAGSVAIRRQAAVRFDGVTEAWHDLSPRSPSETGWQQTLGGRAEMPLYLSRPNDHYWFARPEGPDLLYVQVNRAEPMDAESVEDFSARLLGDFRQNQPAALVIDLRFNTGGNGAVLEDLMETLETESRDIDRFVITGRATFSAGIMMAARWQEAGGVTIVGEPVGDSLDYWAEGGNIILPNSQLYAHFANGAHSYSPAPCPDENYCFDLSIEDLDPDLPVSMTWAQYIAGRDPAFEAISEQLSR